MPPRRGRGGIPAILTAAMDALDAYLDDPQALPGLNAVNGSTRRQRIERRIACVKVLKAHLKYTDLVSLRVGVPCRGSEFLNLPLAFLARHAGLPLRRAERAIHDLQLAGLLTVRQQCERTEEGGYRGLAGMRFISPALFGLMKLGKWLRHERAKARARRQLTQERERRQSTGSAAGGRSEREHASASLVLGGVRNILTGRRRGRRREAVPAALPDIEFEQRRQLQVMAVQIYTQHPARGRDWAFEQAGIRLGLQQQSSLL